MTFEADKKAQEKKDRNSSLWMVFRRLEGRTINPIVPHWITFRFTVSPFFHVFVKCSFNPPRLDIVKNVWDKKWVSIKEDYSNRMRSSTYLCCSCVDMISKLDGDVRTSDSRTNCQINEHVVRYTGWERLTFQSVYFIQWSLYDQKTNHRTIPPKQSHSRPLMCQSLTAKKVESKVKWNVCSFTKNKNTQCSWVSKWKHCK